MPCPALSSPPPVPTTAPLEPAPALAPAPAPAAAAAAGLVVLPPLCRGHCRHRRQRSGFQALLRGPPASHPRSVGNCRERCASVGVGARLRLGARNGGGGEGKLTCRVWGLRCALCGRPCVLLPRGGAHAQAQARLPGSRRASAGSCQLGSYVLHEHLPLPLIPNARPQPPCRPATPSHVRPRPWRPARLPDE